MDNLAVQQTVTKSDGPAAKGSSTGGEKGQDIFSVFLLLSLIGNKDPQGLLIDKKGLEGPAVPHGDSLPSALSKNHRGVSPAMGEGFPQVDLTADVSSARLHSSLPPGAEKLSDLFARQISPEAGDMNVPLLTDQGKVPVFAHHSLKSPVSSLIGDSNIVSSLFKEGDPQNSSNTNSGNPGDNRWMADTTLMTPTTKEAQGTPMDNKIQSFHKVINQENILQQLSARLTHSRDIGTHSARIRLKPEELGDLCLDISVTDSSVRAVIAVENSDVKKIIETHLNRLEEELRNQGLNIEQFTVEMRGGGLGDSYMPAHHQGDSVPQRGAGRTLTDSSVHQDGLNIPVPMDSGVVSVFA